MKRFLIFFSLFLVVFCLSSCGADVPVEEINITYSEVQVKYSEPNGSCSFYKNMEYYESEFICYGFESSVSEADRASCISAAEKIAKQLSPEKSVSVFVFSEDTLADVFIKDNVLYTPPRDWNSPEFAADILAAYFGEYCNYGALYGYAEYLLGNSGGDFSREYPSVFDLNFLCFDERFVSLDEASAAKAISCAFVLDFLSEHSAKELHSVISSGGDNDSIGLFNDALSKFYKKHSIDFSPSAVCYARGGYSFDYIAKCSYGTFYIEKDWQDSHSAQNPLTSENFLHENYADIKTFFEANSSQMESYQKLFSLDFYDNSLNVVFTNSVSYSYYSPGKHTVYLLNIDSLMHEYIHSLVSSVSVKTDWAIEGFARYFSYKYDLYGIAFLNADYNSISENESTLYVREYIENIGRPIDMSTDFREVENIAVYSRSYKDPNISYAAGSSFVGFLADTYGEEAVISYVCTKGSFTEVFGISYSEAVSLWNEYMESNYSNYNKYEQ